MECVRLQTFADTWHYIHYTKSYRTTLDFRKGCANEYTFS